MHYLEEVWNILLSVRSTLKRATFKSVLEIINGNGVSEVVQFHFELNL